MLKLPLGIFNPFWLLCNVSFGGPLGGYDSVMVAQSSVSMSAHQHLTVCHTRQKSLAGCRDWQGFFFIYKKNVPDCMNSKVFVGRFGSMTQDRLCNLFLTFKKESEGFRSIHLVISAQITFQKSLFSMHITFYSFTFFTKCFAFDNYFYNINLFLRIDFTSILKLKLTCILKGFIYSRDLHCPVQ